MGQREMRHPHAIRQDAGVATHSQFRWWQSRPYLLLTAIMFTSFFASGLTKPLFSIRARDLGAALWEIGLIGMVGQIAGAAVQYLWGKQSDRLMRRKPLVLVGMAGLALSVSLTGLLRSYAPLYVAEAIAGLAAAAKGVGSLALIGDILEDVPNRGRLMGLHRGLGSLAFGLAALFGGSIADAYGTAVPFLIGGAVVLVGFLLTLWLGEAPNPSAQDAGPREPAATEPIPWRRIWLVMPFLVLVFFWMFANSSAFTFWPVYMRDQGLSQTLVTRLWGIAALGEAVAMVVAGYLCERLGSRRVIAVGMAGMGLVFVAYAVIPRLPWLVLIQMVRSLAYSSYSAAAMLYATQMGLRRQRGRMAGLQATASSLGGISGAAVGGGMAEQMGLATMIRSVGLAMALAGLLGGRLIQPPERGLERDGKVLA